jgi:energy-coupling factor transport system permease protein
VAILIISLFSHLHRELCNQIPLIVIMSISLILLTVLTQQTGDVIAFLIPDGIPFIGGHILITTGALDFSAILILRFVCLIFAFQLLVISTQPRDLIHALQKMRLPVDYTLMFLIALRFIPTLQLEGQRIHEAQLARGYNPGKGVLGKIRSLTPIMIPLVSNSLAKTQVLGLTIDLRGYRSGKRTSIRDERLKIRDYIAFCGLFLACIAFAWITFIQVV